MRPFCHNPRAIYKCSAGGPDDLSLVAGVGRARETGQGQNMADVLCGKVFWSKPWKVLSPMASARISPLLSLLDYPEIVWKD
jgi:hypothetical protein